MRSIPVGKFTTCLLLIAVVLLVLYTLPFVYMYLTLLHGYVGKFVEQRWSPFVVRDTATRADLSLIREESTLESTLTSTSENYSFSSDMSYHGHDLLTDVSSVYRLIT